MLTYNKQQENDSLQQQKNHANKHLEKHHDNYQLKQTTL